jgi:hypothetical protein
LLFFDRVARDQKKSAKPRLLSLLLAAREGIKINFVLCLVVSKSIKNILKKEVEMKKKWLLTIGLVVVLWLFLSALVAAQEGIPYNGFQWGYAFEVDPRWQPKWVEPVSDFHLGEYFGPDEGWTFWYGSLAQPVYMGEPEGIGFREVELLGYQDKLMYIHDFGVHIHDGRPVVVVSPPMVDHGDRVQFVYPTYYGFVDSQSTDWVPQTPLPELIVSYEPMNWQP